MTKTDLQLKQDIEAELSWDPKVNAAHIGVTVENGAVSLMGTVDTYAEKWAAENATKRVGGVRTVAQDLTVKVLSAHQHNDSEIANALQSTLKWDVFVPNTVTARVENGEVTLQGEVGWNFEREAAERATRYLAGVVSVYNAITIRPEATAAKVKDGVQAALQRQATADGKSIQVDIKGGKVTLTGHASSWQAIDDAANAAWAAPGITEVVDNLTMSTF